MVLLKTCSCNPSLLLDFHRERVSASTIYGWLTDFRENSGLIKVDIYLAVSPKCYDTNTKSTCSIHEYAALTE